MSQDKIPPNVPAMPFPESVKLAIVGLLLVIACLSSIIVIVVRAGSVAITEPIGMAVAILVLYGLCRGHRLAYLWGRRIGLFGALLNLAVAVGHLVASSSYTDSHVLLAGICAAASLAQLVVFASLGFASAREYFRLTCPQCQSHEATANDFFYDQAKCERCGALWR